MEPSEATIRKADWRDWWRVYWWRRDSQQPASLRGHIKWWWRGRGPYFWIVSAPGAGPIGYIRIENRVLSYLTRRHQRRKGYGQMLCQLAPLIWQRVPHSAGARVWPLRAYVTTGRYGISGRCLERAGWRWQWNTIGNDVFRYYAP